VRVIAGEWRGRPLVAPSGRATRPTSDKVREAVFDTLTALLWERRATAGGGSGGEGRSPFAGLEVLDLYAGSGALGLEALSRGAARCTFVERDRAALAALHRNLASLQVTRERAVVVPRPVAAALAADARKGVQYTLLLADPPYRDYAEAEGDLAPFLDVVLAPAALAVVETARGQRLSLPLSPLRVKRYGDTQVTVLARRAAGEERPTREVDDLRTNGEAPCPTK
jgi:16S rRNA (guanine966-N2)-methyltransferase